MQTNTKIKIIKRAERALRHEAAAAQTEERKAVVAAQQQQVAARDAVITIKEWVGELRRKKNAEAGAAHAFKNLFTEAA